MINGTIAQGFIYGDQLLLVGEVNSAGTRVSRFVYGSKPNIPDYMIRGTTTYRIFFDQLGSPLDKELLSLTSQLANE